MTEKKTTSSARLSGGETPTERSSEELDYLRTPKSQSPILKRSRSFNLLVVQLSIDPSVRSVRFIDSLPALGRRVTVDMLIAEHDDGKCFAFDLVDERRAVPDLDSLGLLLLALEENGISLVEVDRKRIGEEPRSSNCELIWRHRGYPVDDSTKAAILRALKKNGPLVIRKLAEIAGISQPIKTVCALAWKGIVAVDLTKQLDLDAQVDRRRRVIAVEQPSFRGP
jgi:hypothetical protein